MTQEQFERYKRALIPGALVFFRGKDFIGKVIAEGQKVRTPSDPDAKYSHVAFVDADGNISESTIFLKVRFDKIFPFIHFTYVSGINIEPAENIEQLYLTVCYIKGITVDQIEGITAEGKRLKGKKIFYPVIELVGALLVNIAYSFLGLIRFINPKAIDEARAKLLANANPFDEKRGMYCCAYVNHCYEKFHLRLIPVGMSESVCMVNDVYNKNLIGEQIKIVDNN